MRSALLILIRGYQWVLSPMMGASPKCRFYPSCSCYAHEAITRHGALRGSFLAIMRLGRCNPWNDGGYDPVPISLDKSAAQPTTSEDRPNQFNQN